MSDYIHSQSIYCDVFILSYCKEVRPLVGGGILSCGSHMGFGGHGIRFMTVEEEIEMLEEAKGNLETQIKNIEDRLKKLKA